MENSLKTAVYDVLTTALSVTVHNGAKLNSELPFVDIDDYSSTDWSTKTYTGDRAELRIHVWHADRDVCAAIMSQIRTALDRVELTVVGFNFVDGQYRSSRSITDADGVTFHGMVDFEFLVHS